MNKQQMNKKILRPFFLYSLVMMLAACSVPKAINLQNTQAVPPAFNNSADTISAASISWKLYFADTALLRLIDVALHYNLDRQMALQRVIIARANVRYTRGAMLPQVNAVVSGGVEKYGDYTMNGVGNYDTDLSPNISKDQHIPNPYTDIFLGLRSSWEIDVWGKLKNKNRAAYAQYLASEKGQQWVTTQLVAEVVRLYYELQAQDDNKEIVQHNIQLQERAYEIVQAQKEGGRANELAVQQFTA